MNAHGIVIEQHMFTLNGYHMKVNNIGGGYKIEFRRNDKFTYPMHPLVHLRMMTHCYVYHGRTIGSSEGEFKI